MKRIKSFLSMGLLLSSLLSWGQTLRISIIDVYGLREVSEAEIRSRLTIREGDSVKVDSIGQLREEQKKKLLEIPGVKDAYIAAVCCDDRQRGAMLFIGIAESNFVSFVYHPAPQLSVKLSPDITGTYREYSKALLEAIQKGNAGEDDSQGHALANDSALRLLQERFVGYANRHVTLLNEVIRRSSDPEQRAMAAQVIAYARNKRQIIPVLLYAVYDNDEDVRNNATRTLAVMASATHQPGLRAAIPAAPFIAMIGSLVWSDRNKGLVVLLKLTESSDSDLPATLKKQSVPDLAEMARWQDNSHASAAYLILGRMAGLREEETIKALNSPDKNIYLSQMLHRINAQ